MANNTWALSEALRPLVLNFHFQRSGKTVYVITGFTGFIGAITGMKPVSKIRLQYSLLGDVVYSFYHIYANAFLYFAQRV